MEYSNKIILLQGATEEEIEYLVQVLKNKKEHTIIEYKFYEGTINGIKIVISKTLVGTINAALATTLGIIHFHPDIVINQGIAGAHKENIHIGDIIIGEKCCNINAYKMPFKNKEEGSNPFEWSPNKRALDIQNADQELLSWIEKKLTSNDKRKIYKGILGSGDVFNREYDRITWINQQFNTICEDMESIGTYSVCNRFLVPCIGIRIISNNELLSEKMNKQMAIELQKELVNIITS